MSYIKNIMESMAEQMFGRHIKADSGYMLIAFAIFYLAEVIREKELK